MSGESPLSNSLLPTRNLRVEERELIRYLLAGTDKTAALEGLLASARVTDMNDGGMGGIRFVAPDPRSFGKTLAEAQYLDSDGVLVSIVLNADLNSQLFELDFWKVDFSKLRRYPRPCDIFAKH